MSPRWINAAEIKLMSRNELFSALAARVTSA